MKVSESTNEVVHAHFKKVKYKDPESLRLMFDAIQQWADKGDWSMVKEMLKVVTTGIASNFSTSLYVMTVGMNFHVFGESKNRVRSSTTSFSFFKNLKKTLREITILAKEEEAYLFCFRKPRYIIIISGFILSTEKILFSSKNF